MNERRENAIKRYTGLMLFSKAISHFKHVWLSAQLFNQAFKTEKGKLHFLAGLEGVDASLSGCVSNSYLNCITGLLQ